MSTKGFTFTELMIVVLLLVILAAVAIPQFYPEDFAPAKVVLESSTTTTLPVEKLSQSDQKLIGYALDEFDIYFKLVSEGDFIGANESAKKIHALLNKIASR